MMRILIYGRLCDSKSWRVYVCGEGGREREMQSLTVLMDVDRRGPSRQCT